MQNLVLQPLASFDQFLCGLKHKMVHAQPTIEEVTHAISVQLVEPILVSIKTYSELRHIEATTIRSSSIDPLLTT
jgi:hypothetical protein